MTLWTEPPPRHLSPNLVSCSWPWTGAGRSRSSSPFGMSTATGASSFGRPRATRRSGWHGGMERSRSACRRSGGHTSSHPCVAGRGHARPRPRLGARRLGARYIGPEMSGPITGWIDGEPRRVGVTMWSPLPPGARRTTQRGGRLITPLGPDADSANRNEYMRTIISEAAVTRPAYRSAPHREACWQALAP
jgi:hypothetical protein